jgi:hypothetical protein
MSELSDCRRSAVALAVVCRLTLLAAAAGDLLRLSLLRLCLARGGGDSMLLSSLEEARLFLRPLPRRGGGGAPSDSCSGERARCSRRRLRAGDCLSLGWGSKLLLELALLCLYFSEVCFHLLKSVRHGEHELVGCSTLGLMRPLWCRRRLLGSSCPAYLGGSYSWRCCRLQRHRSGLGAFSRHAYNNCTVQYLTEFTQTTNPTGCT